MRASNNHIAWLVPDGDTPVKVLAESRRCHSPGERRVAPLNSCVSIKLDV